MMFDISRISAIDIKSLSEEETDSWCKKLIKYPINNVEQDLDKNELIQLFQFTRSLLNVKHIQTNVLLEELQNIEQKYEDIENELDTLRNNQTDTELKQLQKKYDDQEHQLQKAIKQRQELINELEQKDKELMQIQTSISHSTDSTMTSDNISDSRFSTDEMKLRLKEKNDQIEQLLDKLYDSDRINLDLAEQVAKLRVDLAKSDNDCQLLTARRQMLEQQILELEKLNESLLIDRQRRDQELDRLRKEMIGEQKNLADYQGHLSDLDTSFHQRMTKELDKLKTLIKVKDSEIHELREMIKMLPNESNQNVKQLEERRDQIERLEEELSILTEGLRQKFQEDGEQSNQDEINDPIKLRKQNRKMRNLKTQIKSLEMRIDELEHEARNKDEALTRQRKRMSMLIGGDERIRKLFEENTVLTRMLRSRENRIEFLINQLNKHNLVPESPIESEASNDSSIKSIQQEIELRDQLIAVTVERDVLQRHLEAVQTHMESIHNENLELQMGMKEILDGLRQTDVTTDLVLECPSLEKVCRMLENRSIYYGLNGNQNGENLTQMILLKSELDHIRGQNDQLRIELKNLRADFRSVIDEYTTDILNNWTMSGDEQAPNSNDNNSMPNSSYIDQNENDDVIVTDDYENDDDTLSQSKDEEESIAESKSTEGSTLRPRSRIQRRLSSQEDKVEALTDTKQAPERISIGTMTCSAESVKTLDIGLDPIFSKESEQVQISEAQIENKSTQKFIVEKVDEKSIENEIVKSYENHLSEKTNLNISDEDQYVLMTDVQVQTFSPNFHSQSTQTTEWKEVVQETVHCEQCQKHLNMLNSVRRLFEQERQQFRLQETKNFEMIESLRQNLTLVKKEYKLDVDARNEEIQDLRDKMVKMTNSIQTIQMEKEQKQASLIVMKSNSKDEEEIVAKIAQIQPQQQPLERQSIESNQMKQNKAILETMIECLQNCLKQKDEALCEYRAMLEQMRQTYATADKSRHHIQQQANSLSIIEQNRQSLSNQKEERKFFQSSVEDEQINILEMEKIYENLFVKPKMQENDQLMELLRSTLHQLESVRTKSRERIKQLEMELQTKSNLIVELESNLNHATKQLETNKAKIQVFESESRSKEEKIQTLNTKLNDMIRRNQQSIQTATALKKKVENSIFQESADLRSKITELNAEVRRVELEKWNIEKRLSQERQSARERLSERDQQVTQLNEQLSKLQSLMAKMERKLIAKKDKPTPKIETENRSVQTVNEDQQEYSNRSVRFSQIQVQREELPLQHSFGKKKIIKPDIHVNMLMTDELEKPKKTKKPIRTKKLLRPDIQSIHSSNDEQLKQVDEQFHYSKEFSIQNNLDQIESSSETADEILSIEDDSSRQIVIHPRDRDHMSSIINEIAIVDRKTPTTDSNQDITLMNQIKRLSQRMKKSSSTSSSMGTATSSSSSSLSIKSNGYCFDKVVQKNEKKLQTSDCCRDCKSKLQTHRIEQHLIDLSLERLLDQNVGHLKSSLNICEAPISNYSAKKKSIEKNDHGHYDHTELDCDQIYE